MTTKTVRIVFPRRFIEEPVIFTVAKTSRVIPIITYAKIGQASAEFVLKLEGTEEAVKHALRLFGEKGTVSAVEDCDHRPKS